MKRLILTVLVVFCASVAFAGVANACDMNHAAKKTEKSATKAGEGHSCAMGAESHGASCPMKDKKVASKTEVEMTGKLLCMHCNLKKEEKCRKVFQSADNAEKLYDLCPMTDVDLEKISEEGEATVKVKGNLVKAEDGTEMLHIVTAEKVAAPAA